MRSMEMSRVRGTQDLYRGPRTQKKSHPRTVDPRIKEIHHAWMETERNRPNHEAMRTRETLLRAVGQQIRDSRIAADLTQEQLGKRTGIVGKYVSEIERGTRDVPLSTLHSIVERGLGFRLDLQFSTRSGSCPNLALPPLPAQVEEVARLLATLPAEHRTRVLAIVRTIAALVTA